MRRISLGTILAVAFVHVLRAQNSDVLAPLLTSFSFAPASVNVSAGAATVTIGATITDDLSGFNYGYVRFVNQLGQYSSTAFFARISGTVLSGTYQASAIIPQYVAGGVWKADVYLTDATGNWRSLNATTLQSLGFPTDLSVTDATPDLTPPTLLSASFVPSTVDVSANNVNITLRLQIADNLSGNDFAQSTFTFFSVTLAPPTTVSSSARLYLANQEFHLVSGTRLNGVWEAVKSIPRYSPAGPWQIISLQLRDSASNTITLGPAQLQAAGTNPVLTVNSVPTDVSPPVLTGLSFSPPLFNTSAGNQTMMLTVSGQDNLSGVDYSPTTPWIAWIQFYFRSPSGGQSVFVSPFTPPNLVGGTPLAGTWQMSATWPQYSEEGTWQLSACILKDAANNQVSYTPPMLQAMGLPSTVIVTKPSQLIDGTVGPGGGTILDNSFGSRASITFPPGVVSGNTGVAIDVFANPLPVPTPRGFTVPGTYFVNLAFTPSLASPLPAPGITVVLPLLTPMTPGAQLSLYHIDPVTGLPAPAMNAFHNFVVGTVNPDGVSATFLNVVTLSTVVAYLSNGSVLGDVDGSGSVTCTDYSLLKASFGKRIGQPGFNLAADLNADGVVDIRDLFLIAKQLPSSPVCQ
jgi:hypothetical protein